MASHPVKTCPFCQVEFSVSDLVVNQDVEPIGMMLQPDSVDSMYFFNHTCAGCGTTFAVPIEVFAGMIDEPIPDQVLAWTPDCGGHCTRLKDLSECDNECANAPFRRFLVRVLVGARRVGQPAQAVGRKV